VNEEITVLYVSQVCRECRCLLSSSPFATSSRIQIVIATADEVLLEGCSRSNRTLETVRRTAIERFAVKEDRDDQHADPSLEYEMENCGEPEHAHGHNIGTRKEDTTTSTMWKVKRHRRS
jgi:hypothetical protein